MGVNQKVEVFPNYAETTKIAANMNQYINNGWKVHTCLGRGVEVIVIYEKEVCDDFEWRRHMDYTCENCEYRHTWDCDDGNVRWKCENFSLDENTLSEEERKMLRVMRQVMRENGT